MIGTLALVPATLSPMLGPRRSCGKCNRQDVPKRDQALALLFYRSGWTQEELAEKEGKSVSWISYRLRFGRFLNFSTVVEKSENRPKAFTEGRFRGLCEPRRYLQKRPRNG